VAESRNPNELDGALFLDDSDEAGAIENAAPRERVAGSEDLREDGKAELS
jgi:hypothetical protein